MLNNNLESKLEGEEIEMVEKRLITAALPYINNVPHLGHIVGSHLPADIFARFCRSKGYETLFVGGTDENGSASEIAASEAGVELKQFSDKLHDEHKKVYDWFGISYDNFSRTSRQSHHETTKEFFKEVYDNGFISEGKMKVFYSPEDGKFLADRYVVGECPKCGYDRASADQCESCTAVLDPTQLQNPRSTLTGNSAKLKEAKHLFFDLDKLSPKLEKWIKSKTEWRKQVSNLALGWINEGLRKRSITRDLKNGVSVPLEGYNDKVLYVWFDAPIGYVSFTKEIRENDWEDFWKGDNSKIYNFLGKDNIPFHTIFWPGMLMAQGNLKLPDEVIGLQYLNYEGGKFSKSQNRGVFCEKLPESGLESDVLRAYLTYLIPETADSEFKWGEFKERINSDLIGNYGNFVHRTLSFTNSRLEGKLSKPRKGDIRPEDEELIKTTKEKVGKITQYLESQELRKAFQEILVLSSEGNKYFHHAEPWNLIKEDPKRAEHVLYYCANLVKTLSVLASPYLPETSQKSWRYLGLEGSPSDSGNWDEAGRYNLKDGHEIKKHEKLFTLLTDEKIEGLKEQLSQGTQIKDFF